MFGFRRRGPGKRAARPDPVLDGIRRPDPFQDGIRGPEPDPDGSRSRRAAEGGRPAIEEAIAGRCDRCPAAAVASVRLPSGSMLLLCGHHGRHFSPALLVQGAEITGELAWAARTRNAAPA